MLPMCHCNRLNELLLNIYASDSNFGERMAVHQGNPQWSAVFCFIFSIRHNLHWPKRRLQLNSVGIPNFFLADIFRLQFRRAEWHSIWIRGIVSPNIWANGLRWNVNGDLLLLWISIFGQTFAVEKMCMRHRFEVTARNGIIMLYIANAESLFGSPVLIRVSPKSASLFGTTFLPKSLPLVVSWTRIVRMCTSKEIEQHFLAPNVRRFVFYAANEYGMKWCECIMCRKYGICHRLCLCVDGRMCVNHEENCRQKRRQRENWCIPHTHIPFWMHHTIHSKSWMRTPPPLLLHTHPRSYIICIIHITHYFVFIPFWHRWNIILTGGEKCMESGPADAIASIARRARMSLTFRDTPALQLHMYERRTRQWAKGLRRGAGTETLFAQRARKCASMCVCVLWM